MFSFRKLGLPPPSRNLFLNLSLKTPKPRVHLSSSTSKINQQQRLQRLQGGITLANASPLRTLGPEHLLLLLVQAIGGALILLQHGEIPLHARKGVVGGQLHDIGTGFGGRAHGGIHEAEERSKRFDDEGGHVVEGGRGVGAESAGVGEVAWVDGHGGDLIELGVL